MGSGAALTVSQDHSRGAFRGMELAFTALGIHPRRVLTVWGVRSKGVEMLGKRGLRCTPWAFAEVRRGLLKRPMLLSNRASALVGVMAIITAVLLVGVAIFILGHSEGDVVEYMVDDARSFYIAEGGLERMRGYLAAKELADPNYDPVGDSFVGTMPRGGQYEVHVIKDATNPGSTLDAYEIVSTGEIDGVSRQVKATVVEETFAMYQWFIGSTGGGFSWFRTGEYFEGPVHVNGTLQIDGDPYFEGHVTAGGDSSFKTGSNPVFERGFDLHVPQVDLPTDAYIFETVRDIADISPAKLGPNKAYFELELGYPTPGEMTYTGFDPTGAITLIGPITEVISATNGVAWFQDDVRVWGTLDGELTIGVDGDIRIMDDIVYADSTPGSGPNSGCDDMLGMIATGVPDGNIIIDNNPENEDNCEVHGVFMALENTIEAEGYQDPGAGLWGNFTIYGGLIAQKAIHLAQYDKGVVVSGYIRDYHYDPRTVALPPPFFPFASSYSIVIWEEVVPPGPPGG